MIQSSPPTPDELAGALKNEDVQVLRMIYLGLGGGVLMFLAVVIGLYLQRAGAEDGPAGLVRVLTPISLAFFLTSIPLSQVLYRGLLRRRTEAALARLSDGTGEERARAVVGALRLAHIVRLAILEAAAMLGLVTLLAGILNGALRGEPLYWISALPAVAFVVFVLIGFPGRDSVVSSYRGQVWERRS